MLVSFFRVCWHSAHKALTYLTGSLSYFQVLIGDKATLHYLTGWLCHLQVLSGNYDEDTVHK